MAGESVEALLCTGECADVWIPLAPRDPAVAVGLDVDRYTVLTRPNGDQQAVYAGVPLYLWTGDREIGITAGASAPEILVRNVINRLEDWGGQRASELPGREETITFSIPKPLRREVA